MRDEGMYGCVCAFIHYERWLDRLLLTQAQTQKESRPHCELAGKKCGLFERKAVVVNWLGPCSPSSTRSVEHGLV